MTLINSPDRIPRAADQAETAHVGALHTGSALETVEPPQDLVHRRGDVRRRRSRAIDCPLRSRPERHRFGFVA